MKKEGSGSGDFCIDPDDQVQGDGDGDGDDDSPDGNCLEMQQKQQKQKFYMQDQRRLDSSGPNVEAAATTKSRTTNSSSSSKKNNNSIQMNTYDENIPPVPPLPKDLLANAAKINPTNGDVTAISTRRDRNGNTGKDGRRAKNVRVMPSEEFRWPDEIF